MKALKAGVERQSKHKNESSKGNLNPLKYKGGFEGTRIKGVKCKFCGTSRTWKRHNTREKGILTFFRHYKGVASLESTGLEKRL
jgi:hypothetical protein